jgi:SAM-dependent methyltransferase
MFWKRQPQSPSPSTPTTIEHYINQGRIPWSEGYKPYRNQLLQQVINDPILLDCFRSGTPLPAQYGFGVDERVIEYPWVISRLGKGSGRLLDAGSTLNYPYLMAVDAIATKQVAIMTLAPEQQFGKANISYLYGDLRDIWFKADLFEQIVCISTLEHVGLDNTRLYTSDTAFAEAQLQDYRQVLRELKRVLAPGGQLLLTVPFGKAQNFGWMQQFDATGLAEIVTTLGHDTTQQTIYQYTSQGWILSDANHCAECEYFDVHTTPTPATDRAAAARAVACLEFTKPPATPSKNPL